MVTAIELFRRGFDTVEIAQFLRISEPQALKALTLQRAQDLGLSTPYRDAPSNLSVRPRARPLIRYAGR